MPHFERNGLNYTRHGEFVWWFLLLCLISFVKALVEYCSLECRLEVRLLKFKKKHTSDKFPQYHGGIPTIFDLGMIAFDSVDNLGVDDLAVE